MGTTDQAPRYREIERLGAGGMATVTLAEDTLLGREVALKRVYGTGDPQGSLRLKREALVGASLNHPNLVSVYDAETQDDGDVVIVMEYVEGETLSDVLRAGGPMRPEEAVRILEGVAAALDAIHARGIVHRDVKPANILLGHEGAVKLADLGVADVANRTNITSSGALVGSFSYMAPEQLEGASPSPGMDIYALAAVAFKSARARACDLHPASARSARRLASGSGGRGSCPAARDVRRPNGSSRHSRRARRAAARGAGPRLDPAARAPTACGTAGPNSRGTPTEPSSPGPAPEPTAPRAIDGDGAGTGSACGPCDRRVDRGPAVEQWIEQLLRRQGQAAQVWVGYQDAQHRQELKRGRLEREPRHHARVEYADRVDADDFELDAVDVNGNHARRVQRRRRHLPEPRIGSADTDQRCAVLLRGSGGSPVLGGVGACRPEPAKPARWVLGLPEADELGSLDHVP
jgi:serine/threonine protein kinase